MRALLVALAMALFITWPMVIERPRLVAWHGLAGGVVGIITVLWVLAHV